MKNLNNYFIIFIVFILQIMTIKAKAQEELPLVKEKALLILYNNIDSFPLINLKQLKKFDNPKILYGYPKNDDATFYTSSSLWEKLVLKGDTISQRIYEELPINKISDCFTLKEGCRIPIYNIEYTKDTTLKKGDLYINILKEFYYKENFYVRIFLETEGSIVSGDIFMKFNQKGFLKRIVYRQGEK